MRDPLPAASLSALHGVPIVAAERYGRYYGHEPGRDVRILSHGLLGLGQVSFRLASALIGRLGNKLTVQAVREST